MGELSSTKTLENRRTLNGNLNSAKQGTMLSLIGNPRDSYSAHCQPVTNAKIKELTVTKDVGPFKVTGLRPAVDRLALIFVDVKQEEPEVFRVLGTEGMLCCRLVVGSTSSISNHSWGTAVDLTVEGVLDKRGDNKAQVGLIKIHPIFNRHGFYWGAAFPTEDSMHFEASDQLIREWHRDGIFGKAVVVESDEVMAFGERSSHVVELQTRLDAVLGSHLAHDGIFGVGTRAAVIQFQSGEELPPNGLVDKRTWNALVAKTQKLAA